eukprot:1148597-Pelagomonas_calceolata.AAC.3
MRHWHPEAPSLSGSDISAPSYRVHLPDTELQAWVNPCPSLRMLLLLLLPLLPLLIPQSLTSSCFPASFSMRPSAFGRASSCSPASPTTARAADVPDQALLPALKSTPSSMAAMHGGGGDQAPAPSNAAVIADTAMAETSGPGNGRQSMCSGPTNKNGSDSGVDLDVEFDHF